MNDATPSAHTPADLAHFAALGIDPESTQPRERPVPCLACRRPTMNQAGGCDQHYIARNSPAMRNLLTPPADGAIVLTEG